MHIGILFEAIRLRSEASRSVRMARTLASSSYDGTIRLWDRVIRVPAATHPSEGILPMSEVARRSVRMATTLASSSYDGTIRLWDRVTGTPHTHPQRPYEECQLEAWRSVRMAAQSLVVGGIGGGTMMTTPSAVWDTDSGAPISILEGHWSSGLLASRSVRMAALSLVGAIG